MIRGKSTLDGQMIRGEPNFVMKSSMMCTIVDATDHDDIGKRLTFVDLDTANPRMVFEKGGYEPFRRVFDDSETVSAVFVAEGSGGIDAFVIDKKTGKFSRVSAGSMVGAYSYASVGVCK